MLPQCHGKHWQGHYCVKNKLLVQDAGRAELSELVCSIAPAARIRSKDEHEYNNCTKDKKENRLSKVVISLTR